MSRENGGNDDTGGHDDDDTSSLPPSSSSHHWHGTTGHVASNVLSTGHGYLSSSHNKLRAISIPILYIRQMRHRLVN